MITTPVEMLEPPIRRPRGRPRDPRVEGVVLGATRALLLERGFGRLTIAAVADSAGVGKGTIYLRWPDKQSLVVSALAEVWEPIAEPDTGNLRDDLLAITRVVSINLNGVPGKLLAAVVGEMPRYPGLHALWMNDILAPWTRVIVAVLQRGIDRGEMRSGIDSAVSVESLIGPILSTSTMRGRRITPKQNAAFVDIFLRGVAL